MDYITRFLQNSDMASELLAESGYSTNQLVSAVERLGELCVLGLAINHLVKGHERGSLLPPRFEMEFQVEPINLRRIGEVNLLKSLEEHNVIISLGNRKFRVMLSSMLNRIFALTAQTGDDSIRSGLSGFGNRGPLETALNNVEWEIIEIVHDNVDVKYLEVAELENQMKPQELLDRLSNVNDLAKRIDESGGWTITHTEEVQKLLKDRKFSSLLKEYFSQMTELSTLAQHEVEKQKNLIGRFSTYPRSFVGRKTVPLVGSSWNHRPDFKSHPLIQKFLLLIESNHAKLAGLADIYEDYIREFADGVKMLPPGIDTIAALGDSGIDIFSIDDIQLILDKINRASDALLGQAKFVEAYLSSIDTLFKQIE